MLLTILSTQIAVIALISCFVFLRYMEVSVRVDATQLLYRLVRKLERKLGNVIKCLRGVGGRRSHRGSTGLSPTIGGDQPIRIPLIGCMRPVFRINYARQFTEVGIAILFTFGLMRALRKPALGLSDSDKARLTERLSEKVNDE